VSDQAESSFDSASLEQEAGAEQETDSEAVPERKGRPRWVVPTFLLVTTILSMTWAGMTAWNPMNVWGQAYEFSSLFIVRQHVLANWYGGLVFAFSLALILGAHELGHYFATRFYKIPSTLPLFIPFPFGPTGTCGAVIMMDGYRADRKQIFDIGIAGPLAGLVFAIPITIFGLLGDSFPSTTGTSIQFGQPLIVRMIAEFVVPNRAVAYDWINNSSMNPMLMAAWVGFLVTGLNMIPISQLDGGHVLFGLLGKKSKPISMAVYLICVIYVIFSSMKYGEPVFILMLLLIPLMGIGHPPSRNDDVRLGKVRVVLGCLSLLIPVLCLPLRPINILG
jgi:membrane-associated protease RseP (regulator of RpoE activity)